jgi:amidase
LKAKKYLKALAKSRRLAGEEGLAAAMKEHELDALVMPSGGPAWVIDLVNGDANNWDTRSYSMAAVAGWPHITVPMGYIFGLPVGLSFLGRPWQEGRLIGLAYGFEQATGVRRPPEFLAAVDFGL